MKKTLIIALTIFGLTTMQAKEQLDPKEKLVEELFQVTDLYNMVPSLVKSIVIAYKKKITHIPQSYWDKMQKDIDYATFIVNAKKIYLNNYTAQELQELIDTYNSKDTETYKSKSRKIEKELYDLGSDFGKKAALEIASKLQQYGK